MLKDVDRKRPKIEYYREILKRNADKILQYLIVAEKFLYYKNVLNQESVTIGENK